MTTAIAASACWQAPRLVYARGATNDSDGPGMPPVQPSAQQPTLLIVEDDPATRLHLEDATRASGRFRVLPPCATLGEALSALAAGLPRLLLADLDLPDGSGLELIRRVSLCSSAVDALVMTVFADERHVLEAIEAGATGYLLKDGDAPSICQALDEVLRGGSPISPSIARHLLRRFRAADPFGAGPPQAHQPAQPQPLPQAAAGEEAKAVGLTPREVEVLRLVAKGLSYVEIAVALTMSAHTVTSHIKHIYRKLAVRSRGEAVFEAAQMGLVQIGQAA